MSNTSGIHRVERSHHASHHGQCRSSAQDGGPDCFESIGACCLPAKKLDHTLARKNDSPTWCGVIVVVRCYCGGVVLLW